MKLVDSHSHLFLEEFADDLPQVIGRARQAGVTHIFMPNIDSTTIRPLLQTCSAYPGYLLPMAGLHPTSVADNVEQELNIVHEQLQQITDCGYVAIGEVGLDLYCDKTYLNQQLRAFEQQLQWSLEYRLPLVIHCREAFTYIYNVLTRYRTEPLQGIFHSFTGTADEAARLLEFPGFLLGINGVLTFKRSSLPEVLRSVPLQRLVVETDSPYLTPVPHRGKRNESGYVLHTLCRLAEVYGLPAEEVAKITSENALKVFGMLK